MALTVTPEQYQEWIAKLDGLGFGEFTVPGDMAEVIARNAYLLAIRSVAPQALEELFAILPIYADFEPRLLAWKANHGKRNTWCGWTTVLEAASEDRSIAPLFIAIEEWAKRWHLTDLWVIEAATLALCAAKRNPDVLENRVFYFIGYDMVEYPRTHVFATMMRLPAWSAPVLPDINLVSTTKEQYRADALKAIDARLAEVEAACETSGFRRTPKKRNRGAGRLIHFEWLARWQVLGQDKEAIAQTYTDMDPSGNAAISAEAVRKAIISAAKQVRINLRK